MMGLMQPQLEDKVFNELGVDVIDLDEASERLGLEQDPQYQKIVQNYVSKMRILQE